MVNIRYHHCAYASTASMAQRDNRSDALFLCYFDYLYRQMSAIFGLFR